MRDSIPSVFNSDVAYVSSFTAPPKANLPRPSGTLSYTKYNTIHPSHRPLSPQRLAKLANALGVITPIPVDFPPISNYSHSLQSSDSHSPSVTPTSTNYPNVKYVIHVVPPSHFPHDSENDPESQATFRRGLLIPVRPTLKSQISAIAREYKMPSTSGIALYLMGMSEEEISGPGPRITEDVWKLFWTVVSNEARETDNTNLEVTSNESKSISGSPLRDFASSFVETSSASINYKRELSVENIESLGSRSPEHFARVNIGLNSSTLTPLTLSPQISGQRLASQLLPGLKSSSLIPILAKIEFDIDRKNGGWYEAWSRSRRHRQLLISHTKQELLLENAFNRQMVLHRNPSSPQIIVLKNVNSKGSTCKGSLNIAPNNEDITEFLSTEEEFSNGNGILTRAPEPSNPLESDLHAVRETVNINEDLAADSNTSNIMSVEAVHEESGAIPSSSNDASSRKHAPSPLKIPDRLDHPHALEDSTAAARTLHQSKVSRHSSRSMEDPMEDSARADLIDQRRVGGIYDDIEFDFNLAELQDDSEDEENNANDARWHQLRMRKELDVLEKNIAQLSPRQLRSTEAWDLSSQQSDFSHHNIPHLQNVKTRSSPLHTMTRGLSAHDGVPLMPAFQHIPPARPSTEIEEEVIATPPVFRQPVLVGTPSPVLPNFRENERRPMKSDIEADSALTRESDVDASHTSSNGGHPSWPSIPFASLRDRDEIVLPPQANSKGRRVASLKKPLPQLIVYGNNGRSQSTENGSSTSNNSSVTRTFSDDQGPAETEYEMPHYGDTILPPSLTREESKSIVQSPFIPLSPDPFGRIPSSDIPQFSTKMSNRSWFKGRAISDDKDVGVEQILDNMESSVESTTYESHSHLSRFSADSVSEDVKARSHKDRLTLRSVKSIRSLWRKSNKSISSMSSATAFGGPQNSYVSIEHKESHFVLTPPVPGVKFDDSKGVQPGRHIRSDSALDPFHFDHASKLKGSSPRLSSGSNSPTPSPSLSDYSKSTISTSSSYDIIGQSTLKLWNANAESSPPDRSNHVLEQATIGRWRPNNSETSDDILRGPIKTARLSKEYRIDQDSHAIRNISSISSRRKPAPSSSTDSQTSSPSVATPVTGSSSPRIEHSAVSLSPRCSEDSNLDRLSDVEIVPSQSKIIDPQPTFAHSYIHLNARHE